MTLTKVTLRELTPEERQALEYLAASRTAQARFVERAQILLAIAEGRRPSHVAKDLGISRPTVYTWIHRFHAQGLHGLEDQPGAGPTPIYTAEQRAEVIAVALTDPRSLGLPFGCWTLDRLEAYLNEQKGIPIKRSRSDEILLAEGLRWRHQETWFGERVDPEFAEKGDHRGPLHGPTGGLRRGLPRRDGSAGGQELPRPTARPHRAEGRERRRPPPRRARHAGDRLRPPRQGVHL